MRSEISPQVFSILSALVEEKLGMRYGPSELGLFASKISDLLEDSGFESPMEYYYSLRYDDPTGAKFEELAETLLVGETYFFREAGPLEAAVQHVVAPAIENRGRARVLSAACSTGEEPLTIAMLLRRHGLDAATSIVAADVGRAAIAKARRGFYGNRSFRGMPDWASVYFREVDGRMEASEALRRQIDFRRVNLVDRPAVASLGQFDLVVCRNVLIYFRDDTILRVVQSLADCLAGDGRLLVGASESLLRFGSLLHCEERGGAFLYAREAP